MGLSRRLAMFPLSTVLFPHAPLPLHVFEPRYRALTEACLAGDREFGVVLIARGSEVGGGDERFDVGTVARIEAVSRLEDGRFALVARGAQRIVVRGWLADAPYPLAEVEDLAEGPDPGAGTPAVDGGGGAGARVTGLDAAAAAVRRVRALLSEMGSDAPVVPDVWPETDQATLWRWCALAPLADLDRQRLLATDDPDRRAGLLTELCGARAQDLSRLLGGAGQDGP